MPTKKSTAKRTTAKRATTKEVPKPEPKQETLIDRLLALRDEVENELDGQHSDRVTVGLNSVSRAIGLLADNLQTERQLERP